MPSSPGPNFGCKVVVVVVVVVVEVEVEVEVEEEVEEEVKEEKAFGKGGTFLDSGAIGAPRGALPLAHAGSNAKARAPTPVSPTLESHRGLRLRSTARFMLYPFTEPLLFSLAQLAHDAGRAIDGGAVTEPLFFSLAQLAHDAGRAIDGGAVTEP